MEAEQQQMRFTSQGNRNNRFQAYDKGKIILQRHGEKIQLMQGKRSDGSSSLKHVDKEQLFKDLQTTKEENNMVKAENHRLKIKISNLEKDISRYEKVIEGINIPKGLEKHAESLQILQMRKQMKLIHDEMERKRTEMDHLKRQSKVTRYQELQIERNSYHEETIRLRSLLRRCRQEVQIVLAEVDNYKRNDVIIRQSMDEVVTDNARLQKELKQYSQDNLKYENIIKSVSAKHQTLITQNNGYMVKLKQLQNEINELKELNKQKQSKVSPSQNQGKTNAHNSLNRQVKTQGNSRPKNNNPVIILVKPQEEDRKPNPSPTNNSSIPTSKVDQIPQDQKITNKEFEDKVQCQAQPYEQLKEELQESPSQLIQTTVSQQNKEEKSDLQRMQSQKNMTQSLNEQLELQSQPANKDVDNIDQDIQVDRKIIGETHEDKFNQNQGSQNLQIYSLLNQDRQSEGQQSNLSIGDKTQGAKMESSRIKSETELIRENSKDQPEIGTDDQVQNKKRNSYQIETLSEVQVYASPEKQQSDQNLENDGFIQIDEDGDGDDFEKIEQYEEDSYNESQNAQNLDNQDEQQKMDDSESGNNHDKQINLVKEEQQILVSMIEQIRYQDEETDGQNQIDIIQKEPPEQREVNEENMENLVQQEVIEQAEEKSKSDDIKIKELSKAEHSTSEPFRIVTQENETEKIE